MLENKFKTHPGSPKPTLMSLWYKISRLGNVSHHHLPEIIMVLFFLLSLVVIADLIDWSWRSDDSYYTIAPITLFKKWWLHFNVSKSADLLSNSLSHTSVLISSVVSLWQETKCARSFFFKHSNFSLYFMSNILFISRKCFCEYSFWG